MKARILAGIVFSGFLVTVVAASELGDDWNIQCGDWHLSREIVSIIHQRQLSGDAVAFSRNLSGADGVFRAFVKLPQGTEEADLCIRGDGDLQVGLLALLGRYSDVGGFVLRSTDGTILWQDRYAPWQVSVSRRGSDIPVPEARTPIPGTLSATWFSPRPHTGASLRVSWRRSR